MGVVEDFEMNDCCGHGPPGHTPPKRHRCPVNGEVYGAVGLKTVLHHLAEPWKTDLGDQGYYFCADPGCEVVFFGQDDSLIVKSRLRTRVGVKEKDPEGLICYCFGVSFAAAENDTGLVEFVKEMTARSLCSCDTSNPSGRCCLKDFPK